MAEISAVFSWRGAGPAIMLDAYLVGSALAADYQFFTWRGGLQSRRGHLVGGSFFVHFHNPSFRVAGC